MVFKDRSHLFRCHGGWKVPTGLNCPISGSVDDHDCGQVGGQVVCLEMLFLFFRNAFFQPAPGFSSLHLIWSIVPENLRDNHLSHHATMGIAVALSSLYKMKTLACVLLLHLMVGP